jgi:hypothetical protein
VKGTRNHSVVGRKEQGRRCRRCRQGLRCLEVEHRRYGNAQLPREEAEHDGECDGRGDHPAFQREVTRQRDHAAHADQGVDHAEDIAAFGAEQGHTRDPGETEVEDRQTHHDEDLVEPLEQLERFIEAGHVGAHSRARFGQHDKRCRLRLGHRAGRDGGANVISGDTGHPPIRSTVRLPLV